MMLFSFILEKRQKFPSRIYSSQIRELGKHGTERNNEIY